MQGDNGIFRSRGLSFAVYRCPGNAAVCDAVRRTGVYRISRSRLEYCCYYYNLPIKCVVIVITVLYDYSVIPYLSLTSADRERHDSIYAKTSMAVYLTQYNGVAIIVVLLYDIYRRRRPVFCRGKERERHLLAQVTLDLSARS